MAILQKRFGNRMLLKVAAVAAAATALSGCTYDLGLGYASDGYYDGYAGYDSYDCDPYSPFDSYYDCDYGNGFYNIGFGGGWYDRYWYPGYGFYLFDDVGRRYSMRDHHRRYWGQQRYSWYRDHRRRGDYDRQHRDQGRRYSDGGRPDVIGWPERNGGRIREGDNWRQGRGEGRRGRNDQWRGGNGTGADAVPVPNPDIVQERGRGRGDGLRGRPAWRGNDGANAVPPPERSNVDRGGRGSRGDGLRGNRGERGFRTSPQQAPAAARQSEAPVSVPSPRMDRPQRVSGPRQGRSQEGGPIRDE